MSFSIATILDIILVVVLLGTVFYYIRRGFVAGLLDLVGSFASLAVAWFASRQLSPGVFENFFKSGLITRTADSIQSQGEVNFDTLFASLSEFLPQSLIDRLRSATGALTFDNAAPNIAEQVVENVIAPLIVPIITVVVFFAVFLVCRMLLALLIAVLTNVNRLPIIGGANKMLGSIIGLVAGAINVLLILCFIWAAVIITSGKLPVLNDFELSGSYFYSAFARYNPFL